MHVNAAVCPSCDEKLKQVHPTLARWVKVVRSTHPDAHISCGHRGKKEQEDAFTRGASRARYGQSGHNCLPAMAVDFFRLTQSQGAAFDRPWYESTIAPLARASGLIWGGDWKSIKDAPHVEMAGFIAFKE